MENAYPLPVNVDLKDTGDVPDSTDSTFKTVRRDYEIYHTV